MAQLAALTKRVGQTHPSAGALNAHQARVFYGAVFELLDYRMLDAVKEPTRLKLLVHTLSRQFLYLFVSREILLLAF